MVKHSGASMLMWGGFGSSPGAQQLVGVDETLYRAKKQEENLLDSQIHVLEWSRQSVDQKPVEKLWQNLKNHVYRCSPNNLSLS